MKYVSKKYAEKQKVFVIPTKAKQKLISKILTVIPSSDCGAVVARWTANPKIMGSNPGKSYLFYLYQTAQRAVAPLEIRDFPNTQISQ